MLIPVTSVKEEMKETPNSLQLKSKVEIVF